MHFPKPAALITGIFLAVILLVGGFFVLQTAGGRAADEEPRDVVVSDITSSSAKISFATGSRAQGVVEYGLSPTTLNLLAPESEPSTNHEVELTLLSEDTTYYFQISIGGKKYDNAGVPWTFSTASSNAGSNRVVPTLPSRVPSQARSPLVTDGPSPCTETSCEKIKLKLGKGCTTQDYVKCIKRGRGPTNRPLTTP